MFNVSIFCQIFESSNTIRVLCVRLDCSKNNISRSQLLSMNYGSSVTKFKTSVAGFVLFLLSLWIVWGGPYPWQISRQRKNPPRPSLHSPLFFARQLIDPHDHHDQRLIVCHDHRVPLPWTRSYPPLSLPLLPTPNRRSPSHELFDPCFAS